ncbi:MAG: Abortive infection protein [Parcubacteria group bacterium GW2011_GWA2_39_18]|nr:MAG: Abortive infection protein [Parcubacteria group bacterium GW2011_GWA2_39_18]
MALALVYCLAVIKTQKIGRQKLGLCADNFLVSLKELLLPTIFFLVIIWVGLKYIPWVTSLLNIKALDELSNILVKKGSFLSFVIIYSLLSVPLQEFIFRGFYLSRLELVSKNRLFLIFYSALIFMLIHTPFKSIPLDIGAFILGLWWADNFLRYRNLFSIVLIHLFVGGLFDYLVISLIGL